MNSNRPFGNDSRETENPFLLDRSKEIVQADLVSPPPSGGGHRLLMILFGGGLVVLLLLVGVIVAITYAMTRDGSHLTADQMLKSDDAKWEMVRDGFSNPTIEVSEDEFKSIDQTVRSVMKYGYEDATDAVRAFVDPDGFMDQVERSGNVHLRFADRAAIRRSFDVATNGPVGYLNYKIVNIKRLRDDEAAVFLFLWDGEDEIPTETIWWMRKTHNRWKVIDWESMWECVSEASQYGVLCADQESRGVQNFYRWMESLIEAATVRDQGDYAKARKLADQACRTTVHGKLNGFFEMNNALFYFTLEEYEAAMKRLDGIRYPEQYPGIYLLRGRCLARMGRDEEAIGWLDRYSEKIGLSPSAMRLKADRFLALDRKDEAIDLYLSLARQLPEHSAALDLLIYQIPEERVEELGALVNGLDDPAKKAMDIAMQIYSPRQKHIVDEMSNIAEANGNDPAIRNLIDSVSSRLVWDYESAVQSIVQAMEVASDGQKLEIQNRYLDLMMTIQRPLEAYRNSSLKEEAFGYLTDLYDEGDYEFPVDQLKQMLKEHRAEYPTSKWNDYYEASFLSEDKEFQQAIDRLKRGIENAKANQLEDALPGYYYALTEAYMGLGVPLEAYRAVEQKRDAFSRIAGFLLSKEDFEGLAELIQEHRDFKPQPASDSPEAGKLNTQWIRFYQAVVDYQAGQKETAIKQVTQLVGSMPVYQRYRIRNTLAKWLVDNDQWRSLLQPMASQSKDEADSVCQLLHEEFLADDAVEELVALTQFHEENGLPTATRTSWRVATAITSNDDPQLDRVLKTLTEAEWEALGVYLSRDYRNQWIRGLLRMGELKRAKDVAWVQDEEERSALDLFLIAVAERDATACRQLLEKSAGSDMQYVNFAADSGLHDYLTEPEFSELRTEFPIGIPSVYDAAQIQFLYDSSPPSDDEIKNHLTDSFGSDLGFSRLGTDSDEDEGVVVGRKDGLTVIASLTPQPLTAYSDDDEVPQHTHVLSIVVRQIAVRQSDEIQPEKITQLAKEFCSESCIGVYFSEKNLLSIRPFENRSPDSAGTFSGKEMEDVYLYHDLENDEVPYWKTLKRSYQLVKEMEESPETEFEVQVEFSIANATEKHWFPVGRIEFEDGTPVVIVMRNAGVQLFPVLQSDEPMKVRMSEIEEWRVVE